MNDCHAFRSSLEQCLSGGPGNAENLTELSWNQHLLLCAECRDLLAREEALEFFLANLPAPVFPPALAKRVLLRLASLRAETSLDQLLSLDEEHATDNLSERVLSALAEHRPSAQAESKLDLDVCLQQWSSIEVPDDLAANCLRALQSERLEPALPEAAEAWPAVSKPRQHAKQHVGWAVAATMLFALGLAWSWHQQQNQAVMELASADAEDVPVELLERLGLYVNWDLVHSEGVDLLSLDLDEQMQLDDEWAGLDASVQDQTEVNR